MKRLSQDVSGKNRRSYVAMESLKRAKKEAQKSREQLLAFTTQYPQVKVFVGHDL